MARTPEQIEEERARRLRELALSGGISGGVLGGVGSLFGGGLQKPTDILRSALIGALGGASIAAGSGAVGGAVLGEPGEEEEGAHTTRGAVGGALGGGAIGALAGSTLGISKVANALRGKLGTDNAISRSIGNWIGQGGAASARRGAMAGGLGLGAAAAYQGADEGMQMDFIDAMRYQAEQKRKREEMVRKMYGV